jgi:hypothetical protein
MHKAKEKQSRKRKTTEAVEPNPKQKKQATSIPVQPTVSSTIKTSSKPEECSTATTKKVAIVGSTNDLMDSEQYLDYEPLTQVGMEDLVCICN